jgi:hypothetical protein
MPEGAVRSCEWLLAKCREIQPDFVFASEACTDRFIPFIDLYYRSASACSVAPMRYVFPEWTSCVHVGSPYDFAGVNAAVRFGCVITVEPMVYKASPKHPYYRKLMAYIKEINRLREELKAEIFLARWLDDLGAELVWNGRLIKGRCQAADGNLGGIATLATELPKASGDVPLSFSVHQRFDDQRRSIVVVNTSQEPQRYRWRFTHALVNKAALHAPFMNTRTISVEDELVIEPQGLHILVEEFS